MPHCVYVTQIHDKEGTMVLNVFENAESAHAQLVSIGNSGDLHVVSDNGETVVAFDSRNQCSVQLWYAEMRVYKTFRMPE